MKMIFNVLEEVEPYMNQFSKHKVDDNKLISCSPFREDARPSFVVFLDIGNWVDSGNVGKRKGSFIELLAHLSGESKEDILDYLIHKYGQFKDLDSLKLDISLNLKQEKKFITSDELKLFMYRHPYMGNRGVSEKVQRAFKVGYDKEHQAVVIPWVDIEGNVVKLKFRTVRGKKFWYSKEGQRIKDHIFGLNFVKKHGFKTVWIVEAEIDCMYLWSHGIPAIATGTASISQTQLKLLKQSPVEELVIASDNDNAGHLFKHKLIDLLGATMTLKELIFPRGMKDVNDLSVLQLQRANTPNVKVSWLIGNVE
jgi:hypothetical protein